jgi:PKD repeat protein
VKRLLPLATLLLLALAGAATGGTGAAGCIATTPANGAGRAPLAVTFTTACAAASWHWDFGDGTSVDTQTASHTFAAGAYTVTLTLAQSDGSQTAETAAVTAYGLVLTPPRRAAYGKRAVFHGRALAEGAGSSAVLSIGSHALAQAPIQPDGSFAFRPKVVSPGPYHVTSGTLVSGEQSIRVRPRVTVRVERKVALAEPTAVVARVFPMAAGRLDVTVRLAGRIVAHARGSGAVRVPLTPSEPGAYRVAVRELPGVGWTQARATLTLRVAAPEPVARGATGPAVRALEERLMAMHYALEQVDSTFGADTYDAVVAFQKVNGLARTGAVGASDWRVLLRVGVPKAQVTGDAIEVDKTRQVLFVVRHGEPQVVIPVSTGATGNTPIGTFHVYRKVAGWDWVLYYPNYFLRGFAVHGYVDVPPYPASHGCVRIPIWVAQRIYALIPFGSRIVIHY